MSGGVNIRPACREDAAAIAKLLVGGSLTPDAEDASEPTRYADAIERIRAALGEVLVADLDDAVVGVCEVLVLEHLQHQGGRVAEVESMHVAATHRAQGIGGALLDAAVLWASSRECYRVQLTSNVVRDDAHRFYEQHGFSASHVGFKRSLDAPR